MDTDPIDLGIEDLTDAVEVGAGGFGTVYRAHQESLRRDVAVKIVTSTVKDRKVRIRFEREIQAMGMLSGHPNIVTVYDSGFTASGQPYILMDYMEKGSLGDLLESDGPIPYPDVCIQTVKVCGALETAHQAGILHRDIKPENVLVSAYGEPKLGDFGIARLKGGPETGTSSLTASIEHVSPELLEAKAPGVASDIYALGSTMFKLLTGQAAFIRPEDESIVPALTRIRDEPVPDLRQRGVPDPVARVVERAMAKDPAHRFASAADMGRAIREVQQMIGLPATVLPIREKEAAAAKEATRTIHSDDIARSIEDIRALQAQAPPPPPSGPLPLGSGAVQPPPPGGPPVVTGPAPVQTAGPPPVGYPQPGPSPYPAQGFRGQGGPPPGASGSQTPWGKIAAGLGALVLVVVVGVGVALSGGGDDSPDTPTAPATDPATQPATSPATEPATDPPTDPVTEPVVEDTPQPYVYETLLDDSGRLTVNAPRPWTDVELGPWVEDGSTIGWQIVAAPDLAAFRGSWNQPGIILGGSEQLAASFDPATLLDAISFANQCDYQGRTPYSDPVFSGFRDDYAGCGQTQTSYTIVAAWPAAQDVLLLLQFQAVDQADEAALTEALRTFNVVPESTEGP